MVVYVRREGRMLKTDEIAELCVGQYPAAWQPIILDFYFPLLAEKPQDASGIRREFWYRYINQQGFSTLGEIPLYSQASDGMTTLQNFSAPIEVTENYGEILTAYFQAS